MFSEGVNLNLVAGGPKFLLKRSGKGSDTADIPMPLFEADCPASRMPEYGDVRLKGKGHAVFGQRFASSELSGDRSASLVNLGVSDMSAVEYCAYGTLCFPTVLPGVMAMAAVLGTFRFFDDGHYENMSWRPDVRSPVSRLALFVLAALGLTGIVFFTDCAYPLLWISPLMVFVLVQVFLKEPCILERLKVGSWGLVFRFEIAALFCGFFWETWNDWSYAKWVYAVPWVHGFQVWEMPPIGFAGYLPFGVGCTAVTYWLYDAFGLKAEGGKAELSE